MTYFVFPNTNRIPLQEPRNLGIVVPCTVVIEIRLAVKRSSSEEHILGNRRGPGGWRLPGEGSIGVEVPAAIGVGHPHPGGPAPVEVGEVVHRAEGVDHRPEGVGRSPIREPLDQHLVDPHPVDVLLHLDRAGIDQFHHHPVAIVEVEVLLRAVRLPDPPAKRVVVVLPGGARRVGLVLHQPIEEVVGVDVVRPRSTVLLRQVPTVVGMVDRRRGARDGRELVRGVVGVVDSVLATQVGPVVRVVIGPRAAIGL